MIARNVTSMCLARAVRDFGDGFVAVLLPVYLLARGMDVFLVGLVATLSLLGSAGLTLLIGLYGFRIGQRRLLLWASALMMVTGLVFMVTDTLALLVVVATLGTINPSAGSVSIFVPLEHSLLSQAAADGVRTRMFSWYSLVGSLAAAIGALASGSVELLELAGLTPLQSLQGLFGVYAVLGVLAGIVYLRMPDQPLSTQAKPTAALGPSRGIVYRLAALFSIDAFAGGFVVQSLLALWLFQKFGLSISAAGLFFFWTGLLSAASFPVAAWLAGRIGLVNTMVYTHIPASLCLMLAAVVSDLWLALVLLSLRAALSQMDVPTRSSYVMAVVTPPERPAAASVTSVPRSLAAALSPGLAGALYSLELYAWPLLLCGLLKIVYDLLLLWQFRHVRPPEESAA